MIGKTLKRGDKVRDKDGNIFFFSCYIDDNACIGQYVKAKNGNTEIRFYSVSIDDITPMKTGWKNEVAEDFRYREFYFEEEILEFSELFFNKFLSTNREYILYNYLKTKDAFVFKPAIKEAKVLKVCKMKDVDVNDNTDRKYSGYGMVVEFKYSYVHQTQTIVSSFFWPIWIHTLDNNEFVERFPKFIFDVSAPFVFSEGMVLEKDSGFEGRKDQAVLCDLTLVKS